MKETRGNRLHITLFGKMNTGKSSIVNKIFNQEISIVSDKAGTTTDINQKAMEMLPIGPVLITDTAGLDDSGELGEKRVKKAYEVLDRTDVAIFCADNNKLIECDFELIKQLKNKKIPILSIINKTDLGQVNPEALKYLQENTECTICLSAKNDNDVTTKIKQGLIQILKDGDINTPSLLEDIVQAGENIIFVIPIDKEAPKGRLILPQVQMIRNALDNNIISTVCTTKDLKGAIESLKNPPKLVITDSQAFCEVDKIVPEDINLTSFSIFFARLKGDLTTFIKGAQELDKINDNDKILICESCSHHPIEDDIGRVKIPNLIRKYTGKNVIFEHLSGHDFTYDIKKYKLIVHCGACMTNRREVLSRIEKALANNVAITNYGITIAKCLNILDRAIKPFRN